MIYKGAMNAGLMIRFMERLIRDTVRKVFLIVDNLKTHHSKIVEEWLQEHTEQIEVFYLPSYSPELNPDDYLNRDLKYAVRSGPPARNDKELKRKMVSHMRKPQKLPGRIRTYFEHTRIRYAAWFTYYIAGLITGQQCTWITFSHFAFVVFWRNRHYRDLGWEYYNYGDGD